MNNINKSRSVMTSEGVHKIKDSMDVWRKGPTMGRFKKGHQLAARYTDEERLVIISLVAQKIIEDNVSMLEAVNRLLKEGKIPGNSDNPDTTNFVIRRWCSKNPEYKEIIREARRERMYTVAESIQELDIQAITTELKAIDPKIANAFASLHKTRTSNMQWLVERLCSEEFSQKMQVAGKIEHLVVSMQIVVPSKEVK